MKVVFGRISSPVYQIEQQGSTAAAHQPIRSSSQRRKGVSMPDQIRIQDLAAHEIAELLAMEGSDLTEGQAADLRDFIEQIGGIENAYAALEMLSQLEKAA